MAGKNNHRYKIRKRINTIKHEPRRLFDTPPILIKNWDELTKMKSETHILEIEPANGNGWIKPKIKVEGKDYYKHNHYLSTHTFYGHSYFYSTTVLRKCGFNIQLENWDGETIYCIH